MERYYGRYERGEWLPEWHYCPCCDRETLEFLISVDEHEVVGCSECVTTKPSFDERYLVDLDDGTYLQCPCCGEVCDTLFANKKVPWVIDGCDNCLKWTEAYEEEV